MSALNLRARKKALGLNEFLDESLFTAHWLLKALTEPADTDFSGRLFQSDTVLIAKEFLKMSVCDLCLKSC